jgi:riboflavin kinase / FMN adenylyltransferase
MYESLVVEGVVVVGDRRGRELGYPTANVELGPEVEMPPDGVYAGLVELPTGPVHPAALSIGNRPTYYERGPRVLEAFLLDFDGDIYGERVRVRIGPFVRGQARFSSDEELSAQMKLDVAAVRQFVGG